jgi:uncharacterized membrane protein YgdD (TMEM256/DUF423 family)
MYEYKKLVRAFWLALAGTLLFGASLVAALLADSDIWLLLAALGTFYISWAWRVILKE